MNHPSTFDEKGNTMQALNLKQDFKALFSASAKAPQLVDVPRLNFLRIDGAIEPGHAPGDSPLFAENLQALYSASYTLKFMLKQRPENPVDYPVMPLEGLWWVEDGRFEINIKDNWHYTVQIMQPDLVTSEIFAEALLKLRKKKGDIEAFSRLRLEPFHEGLAVQMLHIGPYATEPATVEKMDAYLQAESLQKTGHHHEIYLGDPMRADPAKLKTILRHPVVK
jgi:hypothetical protein